MRKNSRQAPVVKCKKAKSEDFFSVLIFRAWIFMFLIRRRQQRFTYTIVRDFCFGGFMINLYHYTCRMNWSQPRRETFPCAKNATKRKATNFFINFYLRRRIETLENRYMNLDRFFLAPNSFESSVVHLLTAGNSNSRQWREMMMCSSQKSFYMSINWHGKENKKYFRVWRFEKSRRSFQKTRNNFLMRWNKNVFLKVSRVTPAKEKKW